VRQYRLAKGMTPVELARRVGAAPAYISRLEQGELAPNDEAPTVDFLRELAFQLDRHPAELLGCAGYQDEARHARAAFGRDGRAMSRAIADELRSETRHGHRAERAR
jgi:transcriptional regulator with XRE-family HTH domain